jgi:ABC-type amino acid transport system permease subunit
MLLAACLVFAFAACKKEEVAAPVEAAPLTAPTTADDVAWKTYLQDVVTRNMGTITNSPFVFYLTSQSNPKFESDYKGQLDQVTNSLARGIVGGNLVAFGSPESAKMADIVVAGFKGVPAGTMENVKILFIGQAADNERVKAAVAPAGVDYVFIEAK